MFGHQNTYPGRTVSSHEASTKVAWHLRAGGTHSSRSTLDNSPLHPLLLWLPQTVFRNALFCIDACKGGDAPLIPCAFTSVRALPLGDQGKFQWKKRGGKATFCHTHLPAPGTFKLYRETARHFVYKTQPRSERQHKNGQSICSALPFPLHPLHMPQTKRERTPSFSPVKSKWMLPLGDHRKGRKWHFWLLPPCNDNSALEQAVLRTHAKPAYLCFAIYDSFVL